MTPKPYHRFSGELWAITESGAAQWQSLFRYEAPTATKEGRDFFGNTRPQMQIVDGIAIVPLIGPMIRGAGFLEKGFGAVSHEDISAMLDEAEHDPTVRAILLDANSPGGTVNGSPELSTRIASAKKPTYAFTGGMAASAAYWAIAGARRIFAAESASVGSVGVLLSVASLSRALAAQGVDMSIFVSGPLKAAGHPAQPVTAEQAAMFQSKVDLMGDKFKTTVTKHRPAVKPDSLQGQTFFGEEAKSRGLIDEIVSGLPAALAKVRAASPAPKPATPPGPTPGSAQDFASDVRQFVESGLTRAQAIAEAIRANPAGHRAWLANRLPL
jgi:capsid assembly protease